MADRSGNVEAVTDFLFLGSKIAADDACSCEIKRQLLLGRKAMTNLDSVLKSKDIILLTKAHIVKATVFPVAMYECESYTIKKAECQRSDVFELWCWRRLRVQGGVQRSLRARLGPSFRLVDKQPPTKVGLPQSCREAGSQALWLLLNLG